MSADRKLCCSVNPFMKGMCKDCYAEEVGQKVADGVESILRRLDPSVRELLSSQKD